MEKQASVVQANAVAPRRRGRVSKVAQATIKISAPPPAEVFLDAAALNARLLAGHQLAITESNGEVVRCTVVLLNERVPPELFDSYLASGLIQERPTGQQFGISSEGRKRLR